MNKLITKLAVLAMGAASVMGVNGDGLVKASAEEATEDYTLLTSVADIDSTATYYLGVVYNSQYLFHYATISTWGRIATELEQTPYSYTLAIVDAEASTFTAYAKTSDGTSVGYLTVNANGTGFSMSSSSTTIRFDATDSTIHPASTSSTRYIQRGGNSGLRCYNTGSSYTPAHFYKIKQTTESSAADIAAEIIGRMDEIIQDDANGIAIGASYSARIAKIISDYESATEAVKAELDENDAYKTRIDQILSSHNKAIVNDLWYRITALEEKEGGITKEDESTIQGFKDEYAALTADQKTLMDSNAYSYGQTMDALDQALTEAFVKPVEDMITELPEASAILDGTASWSDWNVAASNAQIAYEELGTRQSSVNATLAQKLTDVIAALEQVKPETTETLYSFSASSNTQAVYPTGWGGTLQGLFNEDAAFKVANQYTEIKDFRPVNVKKVSSVVVTVYSVTNSTSNTANVLTVYGLNGGETIDGCSGSFEPKYMSNANASAGITNANANPMIVSLSSETPIEGIRVQITKRVSNVILAGISISYVVEETYSDEYVSLVNDITELNTCTAYINAAEYRARYNALAADEQAAFDARSIIDHDTAGAEVSVTCGAKLAYLEYLVENPPKEVSTGSSVINNAKEQTPVTLIVLVAVLGLSAVTAYYFINKKKLQA